LLEPAPRPRTRRNDANCLHDESIHSQCILDQPGYQRHPALLHRDYAQSSSDPTDPHRGEIVLLLLLGNPRTRDDWHAVFADAGTDLQRLRETGKLTRGLRDVIALHVIFHWNRIGLPAQTQATLARAAKEAIFGSAPATPPSRP
jgi:hypothetical protein